MPSQNEIEAAAKAIACHADGGNIHPGSSLLTPSAIREWRALAQAALEAAERAFVKENMSGFDESTMEEFRTMEAKHKRGMTHDRNSSK